MTLVVVLINVPRGNVHVADVSCSRRRETSLGSGTLTGATFGMS